MPMPNLGLSPSINQGTPVGATARSGVSPTEVRQQGNQQLDKILAEISDRLASVTNLRTTTQSGMFEAFGNNFLTRTANAGISGIGDMVDRAISGPPEKKVSLEEILAKQGQTFEKILDTITNKSGTSDAQLLEKIDTQESVLTEILDAIKHNPINDDIRHQKDLLESILSEMKAIRDGTPNAPRREINQENFPGMKSINKPLLLTHDSTITKPIFRTPKVSAEAMGVPQELNVFDTKPTKEKTNIEDVVSKKFTPYTKEKIVAEAIDVPDKPVNSTKVQKANIEDVVSKKFTPFPVSKEISRVNSPDNDNKEVSILQKILTVLVMTNKNLQSIISAQPLSTQESDLEANKGIKLGQVVPTLPPPKEIASEADSGAAGGILSSILSVLGLDTLKGAFSKLADGAISLWKTIKEGAASLGEKIVEFGKSMWESAKGLGSKASEAIGQAYEATKAKGSQIISKGAELLSEGWEATKVAGSKAMQIGSEVGSKAVSAVKEFGGTLGEVGSKGMEALSKAGGKVAGSAAEVLSIGSKAGRLVPGVGTAIIAGDIGYHGYKGYNESNEILGKEEGHAPTALERGAGMGASIIDSMSLGLIKKEQAGKFLEESGNKLKSFFGMPENKPGQFESVSREVDQAERKERLIPLTPQSPVQTNTNINNQTILPTRSIPTNPDLSWNRYVDSSLKIA